MRDKFRSVSNDTVCSKFHCFNGCINITAAIHPDEQAFLPRFFCKRAVERFTRTKYAGRTAGTDFGKAQAVFAVIIAEHPCLRKEALDIGNGIFVNTRNNRRCNHTTAYEHGIEITQSAVFTQFNYDAAILVLLAELTDNTAQPHRVFLVIGSEAFGKDNLVFRRYGNLYLNIAGCIINLIACTEKGIAGIVIRSRSNGNGHNYIVTARILFKRNRRQILIDILPLKKSDLIAALKDKKEQAKHKQTGGTGETN